MLCVYLLVSVMYTYMGTCRGQNYASDLLVLELLVVTSSWVWFWEYIFSYFLEKQVILTDEHSLQFTYINISLNYYN